MSNWTAEEYAEHLARRANQSPAGLPADGAAESGLPSGTRPEEEWELSPSPDKKVQRRNQQIEWGEQCTYFAQLRARIDPDTGYAEPGWDGADMIYAVPNSNVAGVAVGKKLVQSGLRRGYPDINVDVPRADGARSYHGLRIEMKRPQGVMSDVKKHQRDWHERLRDHGYKVCVCFGWREAWEVTAEYLGWDDL